jgi:hypothetical protein
MIWSVSKGKMFNQCQRKWFYYEKIASATSNDPLRKEAHLLKQLQSISAWRGSLVDSVIAEKVLPSLRNHIVPGKDEIFSFADELIHKQLQFGCEVKHREEGLTKSSTGNTYCAFYDLEYNNGLNDDSLDTAKREIKKALSNLLDSNLIQKIAKENEYVISQRSLRFHLAGIPVTSTPDMVVFFLEQPPQIIDWKVHAFGNSDAWLQLGTYSLALSRVNPHKDFPESFKTYINKPESYKLLEYQLLKNVQRHYSLNHADILDIEDHIFLSASQMKNMLNEKKSNELDFSLFKTAYRPQICGRCQFKKLCGTQEAVGIPKPIQQTLFGVFK